MNNLEFESTQYTPQIHLNAENGTISISGKSYPENTYEFYQPVMEWIKEYFSVHARQKTTVNLEIIYFNSTSSKLFFELFDILDEKKDKYDIEINWLYDVENESALETGEDFIEDFKNLKINLVSVTYD